MNYVELIIAGLREKGYRFVRLDGAGREEGSAPGVAAYRGRKPL